VPYIFFLSRNSYIQLFDFICLPCQPRSDSIRSLEIVIDVRKPRSQLLIPGIGWWIMNNCFSGSSRIEHSKITMGFFAVQLPHDNRTLCHSGCPSIPPNSLIAHSILGHQSFGSSVIKSSNSLPKGLSSHHT
jgi:hypothetical protein